MDAIDLLTIGYDRWDAESRWRKLVETLHAARVEVLVDIRHSPCPSNPDHPKYGQRDWHLQAGENGIDQGLRAEGISYLWLVELGNPQKNDPEMRVLRKHLADPSRLWPVHRGLAELRRLVVDERSRCCLMCACKALDSCHRRLIAEAFQREMAPLQISVTDLSSGPHRGRMVSRLASD
jgi:uncharacterized protein (DUF488 family)